MIENERGDFRKQEGSSKGRKQQQQQNPQLPSKIGQESMKYEN